MELNISLLVVDAAEDAVSLQKAILTPLATQLSTRAESRPTEASLPQEMALKIRNILEAFAGRSHISRRTEDGFIAAFGFLAPNPAAIPSITAEHEGTITALRDILCTDVDRPLRVVPPADANLFTLMGATLLAGRERRASSAPPRCLQTGALRPSSSSTCIAACFSSLRARACLTMIASRSG